MTAVSAFLQFAKWVLRKKLPLTFFVMLFFLFTIVNGDGSVSEGQWPRASFSGFTVRIPALGEFFELVITRSEQVSGFNRSKRS